MDDAGVRADVEHSLEVAKAFKEQAVRRAGKHGDLPLAIDLRREGVSLGLAIPVNENDFPLGDRAEVLRVFGAAVALTDVDQAVIIADVYGHLGDRDDYLGYEYGELASRFADGDPAVYEALQLVSVRQNGERSFVQAVYERRGRSLKWTAEHDRCDLGEVSGDFPAVLDHGFKVRGQGSLKVLPVREACLALRCDFLQPVLRRPPRNRPCPCGSGEKAKHCCWS